MGRGNSREGGEGGGGGRHPSASARGLGQRAGVRPRGRRRGAAPSPCTRDTTARGGRQRAGGWGAGTAPAACACDGDPYTVLFRERLWAISGTGRRGRVPQRGAPGRPFPRARSASPRARPRPPPRAAPTAAPTVPRARHSPPRPRPRPPPAPPRVSAARSRILAPHARVVRASGTFLLLGFSVCPAEAGGWPASFRRRARGGALHTPPAPRRGAPRPRCARAPPRARARPPRRLARPPSPGRRCPRLRAPPRQTRAPGPNGSNRSKPVKRWSTAALTAARRADEHDAEVALALGARVARARRRPSARRAARAAVHAAHRPCLATAEAGPLFLPTGRRMTGLPQEPRRPAGGRGRRAAELA